MKRAAVYAPAKAAAVATVDELLDDGLDDDDAAEAVAEFLDALVDFRFIVRGPLGEILEQLDGPALERLFVAAGELGPKLRELLEMVSAAVQRNPEAMQRRARRMQSKRPKKAGRIRARAVVIEERRRTAKGG